MNPLTYTYSYLKGVCKLVPATFWKGNKRVILFVKVSNVVKCQWALDGTDGQDKIRRNTLMSPIPAQHKHNTNC